jgi:hypothetical protein
MVDQSVLVNRVVDMDWRFGVTAATSELAQAGSTFLQLKLLVPSPPRTFPRRTSPRRTHVPASATPRCPISS